MPEVTGVTADVRSQGTAAEAAENESSDQRGTPGVNVDEREQYHERYLAMNE